jgi:pyruvate/2-oxoglutarate dehydrogenase complex dihydrolipoamide dehydrogenase (E3) component
VPSARKASPRRLLDRDKLGGECLYTGCVPSKALIHCAKVARLVRRAGDFGITIPVSSVDFTQVMAYVRRVIDTVGQHDSPERFQQLGVDVMHGQASFLAPDTLQGGEGRLKGKKFVIATGSRSTIPPLEGLKEAGFLTHVEALTLSQQPRSLVILGAGPIGVEFAQLFARLGTKVTVLKEVYFTGGAVPPRRHLRAAGFLLTGGADHGPDQRHYDQPQDGRCPGSPR